MPVEMPSTLKLTYFDIAARGEPIRVALVVGGIPFEDERLKRDQFMAIKPSLPLGSLPVLTIDGTLTVPQSYSIVRYAGKLAGLTPEDPKQQLLVDVYVDTLVDNFTPISASIRENDSEKKMALRKKCVEESIPRYMGGLAKMIEANGASPGFAVGSKMTVADIEIFCSIRWIRMGVLDGIPADLMDAYPVLMGIHDQVANHPRVKEYYANKDNK